MPWEDILTPAIFSLESNPETGWNVISRSFELSKYLQFRFDFQNYNSTQVNSRGRTIYPDVYALIADLYRLEDYVSPVQHVAQIRKVFYSHGGASLIEFPPFSSLSVAGDKFSANTREINIDKLEGALKWDLPSGAVPEAFVRSTATRAIGFRVVARTKGVRGNYRLYYFKEPTITSFAASWQYWNPYHFPGFDDTDYPYNIPSPIDTPTLNFVGRVTYRALSDIYVDQAVLAQIIQEEFPEISEQQIVEALETMYESGYVDAHPTRPAWRRIQREENVSQQQNVINTSDPTGYGGIIIPGIL